MWSAAGFFGSDGPLFALTLGSARSREACSANNESFCKPARPHYVRTYVFTTLAERSGTVEIFSPVSFSRPRRAPCNFRESVCRGAFWVPQGTYTACRQKYFTQKTAWSQIGIPSPIC